MKAVYSFITVFFIVLIGIGIDGIFQLIPYSNQIHSYVVMALYYFFIGSIGITTLQKLIKEHKK